MRGDILLFYSNKHWYERFITFFTKGPFTHVAVDLGNGANIAAHPDGVSIELNPPERAFVRVPVAKDVEPHQLAEAIDWLSSQLGFPYGWLQIVDYALGILGLPIFFFQRHHNDCSTLVSLYLCRIDVLDCPDEPDLMSPNDLARLLKVL